MRGTDCGTEGGDCRGRGAGFSAGGANAKAGGGDAGAAVGSGGEGWRRGGAEKTGGSGSSCTSTTLVAAFPVKGLVTGMAGAGGTSVCAI